MPKPSKGAYVPGAQGHSLAEAIDGSIPIGVNGDDSRDPPPMVCRFKGCTTILCTANRSGRKRPSKPVDDEPEGVDEVPSLNESGIRPSAPPAPPEEEKVYKKGHEPKKVQPKHRLCNLHQCMVRDYEMGLREWDQGREGLDPDFVPEYKDDP